MRHLLRRLPSRRRGHVLLALRQLPPVLHPDPAGHAGSEPRLPAWVPMDDEHTMFFGIAAPPAGGVTVFPERSKRQDVDARRGSSQRVGLGITEMLPDTTDWYGRSRPKADASNDYLLDREKVQRGESYTGLPSVVLEDQAITESMGPIYNRSQEHLGTSDIMIIRTRLRLIRAAQALRDKGEIPLAWISRSCIGSAPAV